MDWAKRRKKMEKQGERKAEMGGELHTRCVIKYGNLEGALVRVYGGVFDCRQDDEQASNNSKTIERSACQLCHCLSLHVIVDVTGRHVSGLGAGVHRN
jgi:hypothetical protein